MARFYTHRSIASMQNAHSCWDRAYIGDVASLMGPYEFSAAVALTEPTVTCLWSTVADKITTTIRSWLAPKKQPLFHRYAARRIRAFSHVDGVLIDVGQSRSAFAVSICSHLTSNGEACRV